MTRLAPTCHTDACTHLAERHEGTPRAQGGGECLQPGDRWVHLRICMVCGHVSGRDASVNTHATKHVRAAGHPLMRSLEPGETWCYEDHVML
ncbi:MAG: UBP-type zinc finger domain-containing protein [Bacteroidota bacterium]